MATYVNDLRLKEIATGDEAGTWGTSTNTNLELIAEAFSFGTEAITTNADTHTTTIADGSTDPGRSIYLKYTGTLDSACTITIGPNTVSKLWFIENGTSGSQNIIISQGSGANVTIPAGDVKAVYSDGAGSGAAIVDAFASLNVVDLKVEDDLTVTDDASVGGDLLVSGEVQTANIGFTDGDNAITISDGGGTSFAQALTANAGVVVDNITIDGQEIDVSSGDLTLDVAGDIILDAAGSDFQFNIGGTNLLNISNASLSTEILQQQSNTDIRFKGNDGGSTITALTLDMSEAGTAVFNNKVGVSNVSSPNANLHVGSDNATGDTTNPAIQIGGSSTYRMGMYSSAEGAVIENKNGDDGIQFRVKTAGEAMRIDGGTGNVFIGATSANTGAFGSVSPQLQVAGTQPQVLLHETDTDKDGYIGIASSIMFIQTADAIPIRFGTSDAERMRIADDGKVGIGENNPDELLTVAGDIKIKSTNRLHFTNTSDQTSIHAPASNTMAFTTNSSERMRIDSSGVVFIGTTDSTTVGSPDKNLVIGSTTNNEEVALTLNVIEGTNNRRCKFFLDDNAGTFGLANTGSTGLADFVIEHGGSEKMRVDSSGNVSIGTSSAANLLHIEGTEGTVGATQLTLEGKFTGFGTGIDFVSKTSSGGTRVSMAKITADGENSFSTTTSTQDAGLRFHTTDGGTQAEKVRINHEGKLLIGTTSSAVNDTGIKLNENGTCVFSCNLTSENENIIINNNNSTGAVYKMDFRQNNSTKGSISCSSSAVSFNTSSDYRLKENVNYTWDATTRLKQLKPARFNFIADETNTLVDGFLAHEVSSVVPEAITGEKDGAVMQGIDQSKLVPLLVKTIQELEARITALES